MASAVRGALIPCRLNTRAHLTLLSTSLHTQPPQILSFRASIAASVLIFAQPGSGAFHFTSPGGRGCHGSLACAFCQSDLRFSKSWYTDWIEAEPLRSAGYAFLSLQHLQNRMERVGR